METKEKCNVRCEFLMISLFSEVLIK
jgi:hypothetical protein